MIIPEPLPADKYIDHYEIQRTRIIEQLVRQLPVDRSLPAIDVGCGIGHFCELLKARGWHDVIGIDASIENCDVTRTVATAICADARPGVLSAPRFGLALALELIEHLDQPDEPAQLLTTLRARADNFTSRLIISTPNHCSPSGLYGRWWAERIRGAPKWTAWDVNHTHIYSSFEFLRLLRRCGWKPLTVTGFFYDFTEWMKLPWIKSTMWPINRFAFNTIAVCKPTLR